MFEIGNLFHRFTLNWTIVTNLTTFSFPLEGAYGVDASRPSLIVIIVDEEVGCTREITVFGIVMSSTTELYVVMLGRLLEARLGALLLHKK